jgi:2-keto-4-pentenoate hydratase/2-oxohepta-3-ene-1,7-dioic acid hydratase in catechol pathway
MNLEITMRLNGEVMQHANTSQMIFSVQKIIEYVTEWTPLKPGDLIVSGTMGGVGFARTPPIFMKPGDIAEVEIEKIGVLRNTIEDEDPKLGPR